MPNYKDSVGVSKSASGRKAKALALAIAIAIPAEGVRQYAYKDPIGKLTICMGSTKGVKPGDFRTLEQCRALLDAEMLEAIDAVDRCRPGLPVNVLAAFADAAYNVGEKIACDGNKSTAARLLATGNYEAACKQLPRWDKARVGPVMVTLPGLTKRRNEEMELCLRSGV